MSELIVIFVLLLINAFFALSEMAIVSVSRPLLRQMAKQGNSRAELALRLAEDPGKFLSTVQVGITLVGTLAGAYGGATIADKLAPTLDTISWINPYGSTVAVALVVTLITYLSVVIGELIPSAAGAEEFRGRGDVRRWPDVVSGRAWLLPSFICSRRRQRCSCGFLVFPAIAIM